MDKLGGASEDGGAERRTGTGESMDSLLTRGDLPCLPAHGRPSPPPPRTPTARGICLCVRYCIQQPPRVSAGRAQQMLVGSVALGRGGVAFPKQDSAGLRDEPRGSPRSYLFMSKIHKKHLATKEGFVFGKASFYLSIRALNKFIDTGGKEKKCSRIRVCCVSLVR